MFNRASHHSCALTQILQLYIVSDIRNQPETKSVIDNIMKKKMLTFCCCVLGLGITTLFAQQGNVAAGGNASGTGGAVSYSIGQVFNSSPSGGTHNLIQGLQQPYEISVVTTVDETAAAIELAASVYPNPTVDNFTLKVDDQKFKNLNYALYDAKGQVILTGKVEGQETPVSVGNAASDYYLLMVYEGNQSIKTFKITKLY